ncbi:nitroreductase [Rubidibacter lacunae KORDI 51-2]|uniref:Nitroreductase n=1 Tax=Rubidibacter lacunae KORDI 51-2 TaxID=582515 RepID=U5DJQ4_9CHRO|nr:NAD(P)H-dependent oxidoreductase [Rubidibacter lacunae]ERN41926.1 nitroreductase [Rubidibacter lacunae KORDI 51-2]
MNSPELTPDKILQALNWRYATKKFDPTRKIPDDIWNALEESLVLAPSSFGLQPWLFLIVRDPQVRQQLVAHSWGQKQVAEASHLVVFAIQENISSADVDRYLARMSEVQGTPVENLQGYGNVVKGFIANPPFPLDMKEWAARQVYIALAQYMVAAAFLGIDTCPMEGIVPAKYDEVLGLSDRGYSSVVACPAGYRSPDDKSATRPKVRYPKSSVIEYVG